MNEMVRLRLWSGVPVARSLLFLNILPPEHNLPQGTQCPDHSEYVVLEPGRAA